MQLLPLAHRIAAYVAEELRERRCPIFDLHLPSMAPPPRQADQGAPLAGIGCGSVRGPASHSADFNRFDLQPGRCRDAVAAACQFSLRVFRGMAPPAACVLSTLPRDALVACSLVCTIQTNVFLCWYTRNVNNGTHGTCA